jgi:hypothetical protein
MEKIPGRTRSFSALVNLSRHALIFAIRGQEAEVADAHKAFRKDMQ